MSLKPQVAFLWRYKHAGLYQKGNEMESLLGTFSGMSQFWENRGLIWHNFTEDSEEKSTDLRNCLFSKAIGFCSIKKYNSGGESCNHAVEHMMETPN